MIGNTVTGVDKTECRYETEDDVLRQYVAGKLSESDVEHFEEHLFHCDRCREEVDRAIEVRAALSGEPASQRGTRFNVRQYSVLAIAAALAIVVVGLWQVRPRQEIPSALLRDGAARAIAATGRLAGGTFTVTWKPVAGAHSYRVQMFNTLGEPVTWTETSSTTFSVPFLRPADGSAMYWKVQALDEDRVVIATSELRKIEPGR